MKKLVQSFFIFGLFLKSFFVIEIKAQTPFCSEIVDILTLNKSKFPFGVASGDPTTTSVVIWSKLWNPNSEGEKVEWLICEDTLLTNIVQRGIVNAAIERAFTIKVNVLGLKPNKTYFYAFRANGVQSQIGRTRTSPEGIIDNMKFAVVSCSNYEWGYFHAYRMVAEENNIQAVLHLGDYIYEYEASQGRFKNSPLRHIPRNECVTIEDYRSRYAQYRLDSNLMEMHRLHPMIAIWDDHEVANNSCVTGAQNHQVEKEGDWKTRCDAAKQAYFEWLPIADNEARSVKREFSFGSLVDLFMLDGRLEGRTKQAVNIDDPSLFSPDRTMLGKEQADWLIKGVVQSKAKWKIIGNQVIFSDFNVPNKLKKKGSVMDMWQGYPMERKRIFNSLYSNNINNVVILTGDVHTSHGYELRQDINDRSQNIGAEFVTPSISSANLDEQRPKWQAALVKMVFKNPSYNPHLKYLDLTRHGYMLLELSNEKATTTWKYLKDVHNPKYRVGGKHKMSLKHE